MNKRISTPAALAAGALLAVALTPGSAVAAGAKSVLLGRSNGATTTTSLSNSKGTPLALSAGNGQAPLKVNSSRTVTNLSADKLDGLSSDSFARTSGKSGVVPAADVNQAVRCPSGTVLTGGGGISLSGHSLGYSGPDSTSTAFVPNSWVVYDSAGGDAYAFAVCYSPSGAAIKGAVSGSAAKHLMASQAATVQRLKAQRSAR